MQRGSEHYAKRFTEGSILRSLVALSVPIVFANILQVAYQLTDTFWVGRLGGEAVAAVSVSFPLFFLLISVGGGLAIAGSALVSQYTGARNSAMANRVAAQSLLMVLVAAALLSAVGYFAAPWVLGLMGIGPTILADATAYLQVTFLGLVFTFGYFMYQSIMRGIGEVKVPLYIVLASVLLNLALDPLFIFGWGPIPAAGVAGAAYATIATQALAVMVGLCTLFGGRFGVTVSGADFAPDWVLMRRIVGIGLPASVEQSTRALGMTAMTFLVASFGAPVIAAYGIGTRVLSFIIIPSLGISMATGTLVGQNLGAGNANRAAAITWLSAGVSFLVLGIAGILCYTFAAPLVAFFVPNDRGVIQGGAQFLHITAPFFGFIGAQMAISGAFRGSGHTKVTMVMALVSLWFLQLPLAWYLSHHTELGAVGLWWAFPSANVIIATVTAAWFLRGSWRQAVITPRGRMVEEVAEEVAVEGGANS